MNDWSDVVGSPALNSLTGAFKQSEIRPSRYYTAFGEAEASFLLWRAKLQSPLGEAGTISCPDQPTFMETAR